jgi:hypothetical protein
MGFASTAQAMALGAALGLIVSCRYPIGFVEGTRLMAER